MSSVLDGEGACSEKCLRTLRLRSLVQDQAYKQLCMYIGAETSPASLKSLQTLHLENPTRQRPKLSMLSWTLESKLRADSCQAEARGEPQLRVREVGAVPSVAAFKA